MVWPILISVGVMPGAFSARAGQALVAKAATAAALDCRNVRRVVMELLPLGFSLQRSLYIIYFSVPRPVVSSARGPRAKNRVAARMAPAAPEGATAMIRISSTP